jgi:hypothetical protein
MDSASLRQLIREESAAMMEQWRRESLEMLHKCTQQFESRLLEVDNRTEERFKRLAEEVQQLQQHKDSSGTTPSTQISLSVNADLRGQPEPDAVDEMLQEHVQEWMNSSRSEPWAPLGSCSREDLQDHPDFVPPWAKGMRFNDLLPAAVNCQMSTKAIGSASCSGFSTNADSLLGDAPDNAVEAAEQHNHQLRATRLTECSESASSPIGVVPVNGVATAPQARTQGLSAKLLKEHMTRVNPRACLLCHGVFKHSR